MTTLARHLRTAATAATDWRTALLQVADAVEPQKEPTMHWSPWQIHDGSEPPPDDTLIEWETGQGTARLRAADAPWHRGMSYRYRTEEESNPELSAPRVAQVFSEEISLGAAVSAMPEELLSMAPLPWPVSEEQEQKPARPELPDGCRIDESNWLHLPSGAAFVPADDDPQMVRAALEAWLAHMEEERTP